MINGNIFERFELKYLLTSKQRELLLQTMAPYMSIDQYGKVTIRNIYFDTPDYRLIRHSIEKPAYKEKLRIRSYKQADKNSEVFVEVKKKYKGTVYKRRLTMPESYAMDWLCHKETTGLSNQIAKEIQYFMNYYNNLQPTVFLSYDREAYYALDGSDFRITFDNNILFRQNDLSLQKEPYGQALLKEDEFLLEIKCSKGIPLWMTNFLTENKLYKTSFSKYGTAYTQYILPKLLNKGAFKHE